MTFNMLPKACLKLDITFDCYTINKHTSNNFKRVFRVSISFVAAPRSSVNLEFSRTAETTMIITFRSNVTYTI